MPMAAKAWPMPLMPSFQITMKAPNASTMPITANTSAPAKVASAGTSSRMPERTISTDSTVAASAKKAQRRAQMASRDVGLVAAWKDQRRASSISMPECMRAARSGWKLEEARRAHRWH